MQILTAHPKYGLLLSLCFVLLFSCVGCGEKQTQESNASQVEKSPIPQKAAADPEPTLPPLTDQSVKPYQDELLELAFKTATAIPIDPHIKDRSVQQEAVIDVCLKLNQPQRAYQYCLKVSNWRRSLCFAKLAYYCARQNQPEQTVNMIAHAKEIIIGKKFRQEWRKNMILAKLAQTYVLLGKDDQADELIREIHESETAEKSEGRSEEGKVNQAKAMIAKEDAFDKWVKALDETIATQTFNTTKHSLNAYAQLFDRFYDNPKRRDLAEEKIKSSWEHIPYFIRLDLLMDLAKSALKHNDQHKALDLVNEAQEILDNCQWDVGDYLPKLAELIKLRFRSGDTEKAHTDADTAYTLYDTKKDNVLKVYRAKTLRPLAEAYYVMGDTQTALARYRRVIDEGDDNPNFRPRAEDFSATCRSMALYAVEPDTELWTRIRQVEKELGIE